METHFCSDCLHLLPLQVLTMSVRVNGNWNVTFFEFFDGVKKRSVDPIWGACGITILTNLTQLITKDERGR